MSVQPWSALTPQRVAYLDACSHHAVFLFTKVHRLASTDSLPPNALPAAVHFNSVFQMLSSLRQAVRPAQAVVARAQSRAMSGQHFST
jgi:hypothetical protein